MGHRPSKEVVIDERKDNFFEDGRMEARKVGSNCKQVSIKVCWWGNEAVPKV